jgi:hypothetical protein
MPKLQHKPDQAVREAAYFIWEREGRPRGRDQDHWWQALARVSARPEPDREPDEEEEKVLAGRADANIPAMLTKDVPGG